MLRLASIAAALIVLAAPAAAQSSTISKDGATLRFQAQPTIRDLLAVGINGGNVFFDINTIEAGEMITPVAPCVAAPGGVNCPAAGITRIVVNLGDDDDVMFSPVGPAVETTIPMTVDGGTGGDSVRGGASGAGDIVGGGEGGDFLTLTLGPDDLSGGTGFDTASMFTLSDVRVSLDDVANDGQASGAQGANVRSDVENLNGTSGNDVLIGSDAANEIDGFDGNDTIVGRGGVDFFTLGDGNDTAEIRDGLGERVLCGAGNDTVTADDIDALGDSCELTLVSGELVHDLDKDGISKPDDCNDGDPAIRPGAPDVPNDGVDQDCDGADAVDRDRDRDGVQIPFDCDDGNPAIGLGKREIYGNKVDEDCNGRADPFQTITTPVRARFIAAPGAARIVRLVVVGATRGTRVQVRCRGSGCPFAKRSVRLQRRTPKLDLRARFKLRRIGRQTIEVRLLRSDSIGRVVRFSGNGGGIPSTRILCLTPGRGKPHRC